MKPRNAWLVWHRAVHKPVARLICFPFAGGNAASYAPWVGHLPENIELCAIQLPGRGNRFNEPPAQSLLHDVVPALVQALDFRDATPCVYFGHSLGALMAFEVARRRQVHALPGTLRGLMVSGCGAPVCRDADPHVHLLDDQALLEKLRKLNGTPRELLDNHELMALLLPVIRADFALAERYVYVPGLLLELPIWALEGVHDPSGGDMALWRHETRGGFEGHRFEGDHFFIDSSRAEVVACVTRAIRQWCGTAHR